MEGTYDTNTWEVKAKSLGVQSHSYQYCEFEASLGYDENLSDTKEKKGGSGEKDGTPPPCPSSTFPSTALGPGGKPPKPGKIHQGKVPEMGRVGFPEPCLAREPKKGELKAAKASRYQQARAGPQAIQ